MQISNGLAKTVNLIYYLQKVIFGAPDGPDPPDGAGTSAGGHLGGGASIRSSPDGQDEAIDTLIVLLRLIGGFPGEGDVLLADVEAAWFNQKKNRWHLFNFSCIPPCRNNMFRYRLIF